MEGYVRDWAKLHGSVHVISKAVFGDEDRMRPTERVAVSASYFKVIVRKVNAELEAIAFLLPNWKDQRAPGLRKKPDALLTDHLVSVRVLREQTGIDFFPDLSSARK